MSRIGVRIKINVNKIEKARLFKGAKGNYLDATVFIDQANPSQYGDHGFIAQDVSKEEREQGVKGRIIGNVEVFYNEDQSQRPQTSPQQAPAQQQAAPSQNQAAPAQGQPAGFDNFDDDFEGDDIPFN